jgi:ribonuclease P protein component
MKYTLKKDERLGKGDFRRLKWTKAGRTSHFLLFKNKNPQSTKKFGVVINRKIKGAVNRNRVRRILREFFRLNKGCFENCHNHFIRVNDLPKKLSMGALSTELETLMSRTGKE